ncbi:MAG TPA: transposase zinc-binding domain-containing protein [Candidatus Brocadiaceae bacterium]|nr:transposase zinc-binding domain-containing protein [Candidatus Brocadiaceae bacterium]
MINRAISTHEIAPIVRTRPTVAMPINWAVTRLPQPATVVAAPIITFFPLTREVVRNYLTCGDMENGFVRVRCGNCREAYLLAISCKGKWLCTSCHAKKVVRFGDVLKEEGKIDDGIIKSCDISSASTLSLV